MLINGELLQMKTPGRKAARGLFNQLLLALPPRARIYAKYLAHHHAVPNLSTPRSFSEKIQKRKLTDRNPLLPQCADKVLVKQYVERVLDDSWLIPTIWSGRELPKSPQRNWPLPFVMKANNASGRNLFVYRTPDLGAVDSAAQMWRLAPKHAAEAGEWLYQAIDFQILIEPFIGSGRELPIDYKFFVFHGEPKFVQVDLDRATHHTRCFFDTEWRKQEFSLLYPFANREVAPPKSLKKMLAACKRLANGIDFVRIDFYERNGEPLFGEMTFYPESGLARFHPSSFDSEFGALW